MQCESCGKFTIDLTNQDGVKICGDCQSGLVQPLPNIENLTALQVIGFIILSIFCMPLGIIISIYYYSKWRRTQPQKAFSILSILIFILWLFYIIPGVLYFLLGLGPHT